MERLGNDTYSSWAFLIRRLLDKRFLVTLVAEDNPGKLGPIPSICWGKHIRNGREILPLSLQENKEETQNEKEVSDGEFLCTIIWYVRPATKWFIFERE